MDSLGVCRPSFSLVFFTLVPETTIFLRLVSFGHNVLALLNIAQIMLLLANHVLNT